MFIEDKSSSIFEDSKHHAIIIQRFFQEWLHESFDAKLKYFRSVFLFYSIFTIDYRWGNTCNNFTSPHNRNSTSLSVHNPWTGARMRIDSVSTRDTKVRRNDCLMGDEQKQVFGHSPKCVLGVRRETPEPENEGATLASEEAYYFALRVLPQTVKYVSWYVIYSPAASPTPSLPKNSQLCSMMYCFLDSFYHEVYLTIKEKKGWI